MLAFALPLTLAVFSGWRDLTSEKQQALQKLMAENPQLAVRQAYLFNGPSTHHVFLAQGEEEGSAFYWVGEGEILSLPADEMTSEDEARELISRRYPNAEILRMTPGLFAQVPIWEVFMRSGSPDHTQSHLYSYIQMEDGKEIRRMRFHSSGR